MLKAGSEFFGPEIEFFLFRRQGLVKDPAVNRVYDANMRINANLANCELLVEDKEYQLVLKLAKFSDAVRLAGDKYDPSVVAKYIFEFAREFNDYYHAIPVLKAVSNVQVRS